MAFAGMVVAGYSPLARIHSRAHARLQNPLLPRRMVMIGLALAFAGLLVDVALFFAWVGDATGPTAGLKFALASLAQTLLILGGTCAVFGVLARFARTFSDNEGKR
jgi:hypothetical protein